MNRLLPLFLIAFVAFACTETYDYDDPPETVQGYVPIYADNETVHDIKLEPAKSIVNPAKIFTYNQYLMVNIINEGFHVIDNSNPEVPRRLFFVKVPGNKDVAIKDGMIYADNYEDIIVFRINDSQEMELVKRLDNVMLNQEYPPERGVYFECVDPEKGTVIEWRMASIKNPKCYRPW